VRTTISVDQFEATKSELSGFYVGQGVCSAPCCFRYDQTRAQLAISISDRATLEKTAATQSLPIDFFTWLIRRKTNFDPRGWPLRRGAKHRPIYARQYMMARIVGSVGGRRVYKELARQLRERRRKCQSYGP